MAENIEQESQFSLQLDKLSLPGKQILLKINLF